MPNGHAAASIAYCLSLAAAVRLMGEWERRVLGFSPEALRSKARMHVGAARATRRDTCACCDKPWGSLEPFGRSWWKEPAHV